MDRYLHHIKGKRHLPWAERLTLACLVGRWLAGHDDRHPTDDSVWPVNLPVLHTKHEVETFSLEEVEKRAILKAIDHCSGNLSKAKDLLGISNSTLYAKLSKYGYVFRKKPNNVIKLVASMLLFCSVSFSQTNQSPNPVVVQPRVNGLVTLTTPPLTLYFNHPGGVDKFRIYYGRVSGMQTNFIELGQTNRQGTLTGLEAGKLYYFSASALVNSGYGYWDESPRSNEISLTASDSVNVIVTSRRSESPTGPWTNSVVVWTSTNSLLPSLYFDHLVERRTFQEWK